MAILDFLTSRSTANSRIFKRSVKAQLNPPPMGLYQSVWNMNQYGGINNYASAIIRQDAMSLAVVARCRNLICSTIAAIPLEMYSKATGEELPNLAWVDQPDRRQPRSVTLAWTIDSLLHYGICFWRVEEIYQDDNRPARFAWIQNDRVTTKYNGTNTEVDYYMIDSKRVPDSGVGSLITFQGLNQGLLQTSQALIRAALDVDNSAAISAATPMSTGIIKNNGADLPDDHVQGILAAYKQARQNRATAYLTSTLEFQATSFSPKEMMYNEARAYYALELARACNMSADMVDAQMLRTQTYQNVLDRRKEFMAFTLQPFISAIENRLSMDDLCNRNAEIRFSVDETFLRVDPIERLNVTEKLLTLGLIDIEQAKEMEDLSPEGSGMTDATNV